MSQNLHPVLFCFDLILSTRLVADCCRLVATGGLKSNTKKVTKKAICEVNMEKACNVIIEPEVPMALRLQSNLLYGVVRVYSQQCEYVLQDAQTAQTNIRTLFRVCKTNTLDSTTSKAK